jgi:hypothetical protein
MANYTEIFFGSEDDRDVVVERISSALGIPLAPSAEPYADYQGSTDELAVDLKITHTYEDDSGIPFEDMPYVLTIRDKLRGQLEEAAGRTMFDQLDPLGYRPMYLVRGLTKILHSTASRQ